MAPTKRSKPIPKAPVLRNVMDIGSRLPEGGLIHFTADQWKQLTSGLPRGTRLPKHGVILKGYPAPDGDVFAQPECIPGPCEICRIRIGGIRPDGQLIIECQCRPDPRCPEDPPPPPPPGRCRLRVVRTPRIRIECVSVGCTGRCRLQVVRQGRLLVLACACV